MSPPAPSFDRLELRFNAYNHLQVSHKLKNELIVDNIAINPKVEINSQK